MLRLYIYAEKYDFDLLITPRAKGDRTVKVCIHEGDKKHVVNVLQDGDKLSLPELFPDWELEISQLWLT